MKALAEFLLGIVLLTWTSLLPAQTADGARPAGTTPPRFGPSRLRGAIFNKRRLTVTRGARRELNFPDALASFSKDPSTVRASLEGKRQGEHTIDRFNPQWVCCFHYDRWNADRARFLTDRLGCQMEEL